MRHRTLMGFAGMVAIGLGACTAPDGPLDDVPDDAGDLGAEGDAAAPAEGEEAGEGVPPGEATVGDVAAAEFAFCEAPRFTVGYPQDWRTSDPAGMLGPCAAFHPSDIDEPTRARDADLHHAVTIDVDEVAFDDVVGRQPLDEVIERRDLDVDGRAAVLEEIVGTGDAMLPAGERRYAYVVDLEDAVLIASTHTIGETDHARDRAVLDRMVTETLRIDP